MRRYGRRMALDRHDAAGLVRLKGTLDHARRLAEDRSDWGRHVALVSLDGVVEYAMWLAVLHRGLRDTRQMGFHDMLKKLSIDLGDNWQPPRRGIMQMHNARNEAQHGGVAPDRALMDGWTDEVTGFVQSLTAAAFGVALDDVLLADAIEDEELRIQVEAAERAIDEANPEDGFERAYGAFVAARRRWRDQQQDAYGRSAAVVPFEAVHDNPTERTNDYADVGVFASDLGEYHWLLSTRRYIKLGGPPTLEDARRALQFAYHWILRWQQFDARYPRERWRQYFDSLTPPTGGDGKTPEIAWVRVLGTQMARGSEQNTVLVQIANVPEQGRGDWGQDFDGAIAAAAEQIGESPYKLLRAERTRDWQLTLLADRELSPDKLSHWIELTVAEATRLYTTRQRDSQQREQQAGEQAAAFRALFAQHSELFGAIHPSWLVRPNGAALVFEVDYHGTPWERDHVAAIFRNRGGYLAATGVGDGRLVFDAFALDESTRPVLEDALAAAVDHVDHERRWARKAEHERSELERHLQAALGAPEPAGNE